MEASYDQRRALLLKKAAGIAEPDIYGGRALSNLALDNQVAEANEELIAAARWFELPHPHGRDHKGECDFTAMKLCGTYYLFAGSPELLYKDTQRYIRTFFLKNDFQSMYDSENHHLLFHTSRYLMAHIYGEATFAAYGRTGVELASEDEAWLKQFIRYRAAYGWGEFDSTCYLAPEWECLTNLFDHAPDEELKRLAGKMLDLLLADFTVENLHGKCGGAHGRIYKRHALDYATDAFYPLQYLYFGTGDLTVLQDENILIDALLSHYRPNMAIMELALSRTEPYENRERKHLHNMSDVLPQNPLEGSIRKYTYWTPDFVMGCVQRQDDYPNIPSAIYAHHEQHEWDITFGTKTGARVFTHHPGNNGNEHGYWTGDLGCGRDGHGHCGHFFQHRSALVALYDIDPGEPYQFIHAFVPKNELDEVIEEDGVLFIREGLAYAALRLLKGYKWAVEKHEVFSNGSRNGVICEAGRACDYGDFAEFRREFLANAYRFDQDAMTLEYASAQSGKLFIDTKGTRQLNGKTDELAYETFDSPFMNSAWGSGIIDIQAGGYRLHLDFPQASRTEFGRQAGVVL